MDRLDRSTENNFKNVIDILKKTDTPRNDNSQLMQMLLNQQVQMNQHSKMITKQNEILHKIMADINTKLVQHIPNPIITPSRSDVTTLEVGQNEHNDAENKE